MIGNVGVARGALNPGGFSLELIDAGKVYDDLMHLLPGQHWGEVA
ncbi:MAG: hypothetical protein ACUVSS_04555 [Anaerolineae bacterium]